MSPRGDEGTEVLAVPHCRFIYIHMHVPRWIPLPLSFGEAEGEGN